MPPGPATGPADASRSAASPIQQGIALHRAGRLDEAAALYERVLAEHGPNADALHLLGLVAILRDETQRAIDLIERAIACGPPQALFHHSLAEALRKAGRAEDARRQYRAALDRDPGLVDSTVALGDLTRADGDHRSAVALYETALKARPDDARLHLRQGEALMALGRPAAAVEHYKRAIALGLDLAGVHNNFGLALNAAGRGHLAVAAFRRASLQDPSDPAALVNLGDALLGLDDLDGAERALKDALRLDPSLSSAHLNLGNVLRRRNRLAEATQSYRRAAVLAPANPRAQGNLGMALAEVGRIGEAIAALRYATRLAPRDPVVASNLCYAMCYEPQALPEAVLAEHRRWNGAFGKAGAARPERPRQSDRRLRVGYVSPDFRAHPVGNFVAGPIHHHDRRQVEVYCYAAVPRPDELTERLRAAADGWRDVTGLDDAALADAIRADGVDILVDLSGHMAGGRLAAFAHRPAPVQVAWAGYPFSTGADAIDWAIVDAAVAPPGAEALFSERLFRLPRAWTCYTPAGALPGLAEKTGRPGLAFGSFNNPQKIDEATLALWAEILRRARGAVLLMKAPAFEDRAVRAEFARRFVRHGVPEGAVDFAGASSWQAHLAAIASVDIALDPLPYTGATTTIETLLMGVPVVTRAGNSYFRRHAVRMLRDVGLGDLVTDDTDAYLARALALAGDASRRAMLRRDLRAAMLAAPVCDAPGFTRELEAAFRAMWQDWCAGA